MVVTRASIQVRGVGDASAARVPAMPVLTPRRGSNPLKRPPHIVSRQSSPSPIASNYAPENISELNGGIAPAPLLPDDLDDVDLPIRPPSVNTNRCSATPDVLEYRATPELWSSRPSSRASPSIHHDSRMQPPRRLSSSEVDGAACLGGRAHRPDTCFLTHTYVKQEIAYLSRRVDEVARYFVALEQMLGTGVLGPLLEKSYRELESRMKAVKEIDDIEEVQSLIDAAVRLGLGPTRYAPLTQRRTWLESGMKRESLLRELDDLRHAQSHPAAVDAEALQQLIDDCVRLGISAKEIDVARRRLKDVQQARIDEKMLRAAADSDVLQVEVALRIGANADAQQVESGASLWHLAAASHHATEMLADTLTRVKACPNLFNALGQTPMMTATACQNTQIVNHLIQVQADVNARTIVSEQLIDFQEEVDAFAVRRYVDTKDGVLLSALEVNGIQLDVGDKLTSTDLQFLVFQRTAGRTPLHFAVMRGDHVGKEVAVIEALVRNDADINACDESGRTPLWYAAQSGGAAGVRALLRHSASIAVGGSESPLLAAARACATVMQSRAGDSAGNEHKEVLRILMRHGATRGLDQIRDAANAFSEDRDRDGDREGDRRAFFLRICESAQDLPHALALAGASVDDPTLRDLMETVAAYQSKYSNLFALHGYRDITSVAEALEAMVVVMPNFEDLVFDLARRTGGRTIPGRIPTAAAVTRLARMTGLLGPLGDWGRVTGALHCTLIYQNVISLAEALAKIERKCSRQIRGVENYFWNGQGQDCLRHSMKTVAWVRRPGGIVLCLEVDGMICCLRLTVAHVLEVEESFLQEGSWLRDEVVAALSKDSEEDLTAALDFAAEHLNESRVACILDSPCGQLQKEELTNSGDIVCNPAVCIAVTMGSAFALDSLLKASASPNAAALGGHCALALAARRSDMQSFVRLLRAGASVSSAVLKEVPDGDFRMEAEQLLSKVGRQRIVDELALAELVAGFKNCRRQYRDVECLLKAGCCPNAKTANGISLLSCAVMHKNMVLVRLLLKHGACVRKTGAPPNSALYLSRGSDLEVLIAHQASLELQSAVSEGDVFGVHELLEAGLDPESMICGEDKPASEAQTLLEYAVELPEESAVSLLCDLLKRGVRLERHDEEGQTILIRVVRSQASVKIIKTLLIHDADPLAVDFHGRTAAMYAAALGQCEALTALLNVAKKDGRDDVGQLRDANGQDAMMHAIIALQEATVQLLLSHGYEMDQMAVIRELFCSCRKRDEQRLLRLLWISIGVFPEIANATEDGEVKAAIAKMPSLLMESVKAEFVDAVKVLLRCGAQIHPRLDESCRSDGQEQLGESAWSLASENPSMQVILREALPHEFLSLAKLGNDVAIANLRAEEFRGLSFDLDVFSATDAEGFGVVDHASMQGLEELEAWCIKRGGCFLSSETRSRALFEPVKSGDFEAVRRRLEAGGDVSAIDGCGRTVLDWCVVASGLDGYVWHCVEAALTTIFSDEDDHLEVATSGPGGSTPSRRSFNRSLSFANSDENERFQNSKGDRASVAASVAGGRSISASSLGGKHGRRKKPEPTPDPRRTHAVIEEALIKAGAQFSATIARGELCLWEPFMRRDLDAVRRRITGGGDCSVPNERGTHLPHFALDVANPSLATLLVECSASPDSRDHRGKTLLWRAVEARHFDLIEACLTAGADLSLGLGTSNGGSGDGSLAHLALETTQPELALRFLTGGCSPNKVESHGRTVLWRALELGYNEVVDACLHHGGDTSVVDPFSNKCILHLALERNLPTWVPRLIEANAPLDVVDRQGQTPLMVAARLGENTTVDVLLQKGILPGILGGREAIAALQAEQLDIAEKLIRVAGPPSSASFRKSTTRRSSRSSINGADAKGTGVNLFAEILTLCAQLDAQNAAIACVAGALHGAGFSKEDADCLSMDLCAWALKKNPPAIKQAHLNALQALPRTIVEEGRDFAAGDLLDAGVPEEILQRLALVWPLPRNRKRASDQTALLNTSADTCERRGSGDKQNSKHNTTHSGKFQHAEIQGSGSEEERKDRSLLDAALESTTALALEPVLPSAEKQDLGEPPNPTLRSISNSQEVDATSESVYSDKEFEEDDHEDSNDDKV